MTLLHFSKASAPGCKASEAFRREADEVVAGLFAPKPAPRACEGRGVTVSTLRSFC